MDPVRKEYVCPLAENVSLAGFAVVVATTTDTDPGDNETDFCSSTGLC